jgi:NADPH2:quinone reductase
LQPGESVLVLGAAGGVGLAAVQVAKAMGARVIAAASSPEKLAIARESGADELVDYSDGELKDKVKVLTGGKGADVIFDPVGGDLFDQALRCIAWEGRLLVIGFASGRIPQLPVNLALVKGFSTIGVYWGRFAKVEQPDLQAENMRWLFDWWRQGKIKPRIDERLPLAEAPAALRRIMDREVRGKLVLDVTD